MISPWVVYCILKLDSIYNWSLAAFIILCFLNLFMLSFYIFSELDFSPFLDPNSLSAKENRLLNSFFKKGLKRLLFPLIITFSICCFLPTTKEALVIWAIPVISSNKDIQELPSNSAKLLNEGLKNFINKIGEENETH